MSDAQSTSSLLLAGLFVWMLGSSAPAAPAAEDDGSVKAQMTSVSRGNDFQIDLSLGVKGKDDNALEGLKELDFEVLEDGKPVQIRNFMPAGQGALRLALVMDYSASMTGRKIVEARSAARALIRQLRDKHDYLGLYAYNDALFDAGRTERLSIEPLDLLRREQAWEAIVFTGLGKGAPMLRTMEGALGSLAKVSGRKIMIVLTDGMDSAEPEEIAKSKNAVLLKAREAHIPLYMVSTSSEFEDEKAMRELAGQTQGKYIAVPEPSKLKEIVEEIVKSLHNDYTMSYTSPNPVEDGKTRNVTVKIRSGQKGTQTTGSYKAAGRRP